MQDRILGGAAAAAMAVDWDRLTGLVDDALAKQRTKLGKANIIVAGRTGVGKSTLVNAVFGADFARTAMGRPVTRHAVWYERDSHAATSTTASVPVVARCGRSWPSRTRSWSPRSTC